MKKEKEVLLVLWILLFSSFAMADVINVPADQPTIQAGINAASNGDTVLVQPGTYIENINYNGKIITIASLFLTTQDTSYISQTVIDGDSLDSVVTFENEEDSTAVLSGFTVTNGNAHGYFPYNNGGGIFCRYSSPSLENVTITGNSAASAGGIFCYDNSSPSLNNVTITGNSAGVLGGGIHCSFSNPGLTNVTITGNSAGYRGGGIFFDNSSPSFVNVTITGNSAIGGGGGIFCYGSFPTLVNSIVSDNTGNCGIYVYSGGNPTIEYSDFWNNEGGNFCGVNDSIGVNVTTNVNGDSCDVFYNIQLDPLFVDPLNGDYHLSWANYPITDSTMSPCIDAGDPNSPPDPDGTIADMGAFYFDQGITPPIITSITDVPDDQGRQVQIIWNRCSVDSVYSQNNFYSIWRLDEIFRGIAPSNIFTDPAQVVNLSQTKENEIFYWQRDGEIWTFITWVPALQYPQYAVIAPTLKDSCATNLNYSIFKVIFHGLYNYYESEPDSGYSVDNLAPSAPQGFNGAIIGNQVELYWQPCPDEDFQYFALYKSNESGNYPDEPYATTIDTFYIDTNITYNPIYYVLTAFDYIGNESEHSEELLVTLTDIDDNISYIPEHYSISQNHPNPFKTTTSIRYAIPELGNIKFEIYNIKGQLVEILINEDKPAGYHTIEWNVPENSDISSGLYFYKLITKDKTLIKKMVLMR